LWVLLRKEKMRTQGRLPPHPRREDEDRCAGGGVFVGGETRSYSRRAAGFAPNDPPLPGQGTPPGGGEICKLKGVVELVGLGARIEG
jgi:hypothetical protein